LSQVGEMSKKIRHTQEPRAERGTTLGPQRMGWQLATKACKGPRDIHVGEASLSPRAQPCEKEVQAVGERGTVQIVGRRV
jgi:hypothetical protein